LSGVKLSGLPDLVSVVDSGGLAPSPSSVFTGAISALPASTASAILWQISLTALMASSLAVWDSRYHRIRIGIDDSYYRYAYAFSFGDSDILFDRIHKEKRDGRLVIGLIPPSACSVW